MNGWAGGWTDKKMDRFPLCSIGFRPLRSRCPVPQLNLYHTQLKQGTGTADHLLPLGCYSIFSCPFCGFSTEDKIDFTYHVLQTISHPDHREYDKPHVVFTDDQAGKQGYVKCWFLLGMWKRSIYMLLPFCSTNTSSYPTHQNGSGHSLPHP